VEELDFCSYVGYYSYNNRYNDKGDFMKTVQMTLDDDLVKTVDRVVDRLHTTRSAFARKALRDAVKKVNVSMLEQKHKKGYERYHVGKDEFSVWESEHEWGD